MTTTPEYIIEFLQQMNESLVHTAGELTLGKINPHLALIKTEALKNTKKSILEQMNCTDNFSSQFPSLAAQIELNDGYIKKVEALISEIELQNAAQPE